MRDEGKVKFKPNYPTFWLEWLWVRKRNTQLFLGDGEKSWCKKMTEINTDLLIDQNILKASEYSIAQGCSFLNPSPLQSDLISAIMRNKQQGGT